MDAVAVAFGDRNPDQARAWQARGAANWERNRREKATRGEIAPSLQGRRRKRISPASSQQQDAVNGMACVGCGATANKYVAIDPAHLWPRGRGGCDSRFCVIPLCRRAGGQGCHRLFDDGDLDLLRVVTGEARWTHHLQHALRHCGLVDLIERLAGARTQWSDR